MPVISTDSIPIDAMLDAEFLVTNGLGGYATTTIAGVNTRKYHGLLIATLSPPARRIVVLSRVEEEILNGRPLPLATSEYPGTFHPEGFRRLMAFSNDPHPRWAFQGDGWTVEKELLLLPGENTVVLRYTLVGAPHPLTMHLRPLFALRSIHELMIQWNAPLTATPKTGPQHLRIAPTSRTPEAFFAFDGAFESEPTWYLNTIYRRERERGYAGLEDLWNPGLVRFELRPGHPVHFVASTDPINLPALLDRLGRATVKPAPASAAAASSPPASADRNREVLTRAARQFLLQPSVACPSAVMTGFPWDPIELRDALMAFPGLLLATGEHERAREMLLRIVPTIADGLVPSELPEDASAPLFESADTSLWFINAVWEYWLATGDERCVDSQLLEAILTIIQSYTLGTRLGVSQDGSGLIRTYSSSLPTTWMNAKCGAWIVTHRAGRPVEIQALWYNALCIARELCARFGRPTLASDFERRAGEVKHAFNSRFWNASLGCCYDVLGDKAPDSSIRPNQLAAIALPFEVLEKPRWQSVVDTVRQSLLTPMGLRTLAPSDADYQGRYEGDVVSRDRAYHQGSVYPFLLGAYATALAKTFTDEASTRDRVLQILQPCIDYMASSGLGQLPELFAGDAPHGAGGSFASARNVGEVLRVYFRYVTSRGRTDAPVSRDLSPGPKMGTISDS
jgi:predicted glycogen debranching enzyme